MGKSILIAIDLSENSLKAVDYVGRMMSCDPNVQITLLNVIREPSPDVMPDEKERKDQVQRLHSETLALTEEAGKRLSSQGIPQENIHIKIQVCDRFVTISELILAEQKREGYETIVIGRRGMTKRQEFLFGSISKKVVTDARDCVVWVVE
jgi:nucleotide-binding universal stress UspA family protein